VINKARFAQIGSRIRSIAAFKSAFATIASAHTNATRLNAELRELSGAQPGTSLEAICSVATQLENELTGLQQEVAHLSQMRPALNDLQEAVHQLGRVSEGIQTTVMDTRMVPIGPLFGRFKRVVHDLARANDKQINLALLGESTELDKRMIDELGDPLIHLIRNSTDHGIEPTADRVKHGKTPHGTITLDAYHRGNRIVISVSDDGRGLDPDRIRAKALAKGLINEAEAKLMSLQQISELIWQPGFSTAERVTEVSGRGMGMDIVRFKIEQLNGTVELSTQPGQGTTFIIKLPLTMAILPSLMISKGEEVFAIPVESVVEIVRLAADDLPTVHGRRTARIRGRVIPIVELEELLHWHEAPRAEQGQSRETTCVIIGTERQELGLVVDGLVGEQDIVIKSLEENFRNVEGIAGASILGDGRVSLILDVSALLELARRSQAGGIVRPAPTAEPCLALAT
jgi:two-component system chemotaxis sensor kinase CheA